MSRNKTVYSVWVCKDGRMKRYRFDNAVKGRRFARKTDGNVWGVTYQRSTPSSRRAVEEHDYGAKHFRKHVREHRNARRRNAMAMRMSERDGMKVLDKDGHVVVDKGFFAFERYCNGRRRGTGMGVEGRGRCDGTHRNSGDNVMVDIKLMQGDCLERMKELQDSSIDLTVTSPPYDNLRTYNGNNALWGEHVWKAVIKDLYRVTKDGGVVVWVVGDATINGSETGTSFRQALWAMECGFRLHDTMIYGKNNYIPLTHNRYEQAFEFMFVWAKGRPKTFNPIMVDCKTAGSSTKGRTFYQTNNQNFPTKTHTDNAVGKQKQKGNVWDLSTNAGAKGHPAQFPEALARDHILSWSNEGDTVFDPFMGSGTTGKMAKLLNRNFIGIELDEGYFKIAQDRISTAGKEGAE